jgi:small subunit ribosomal protein S14
MAKKSDFETNKRRRQMADKYAAKRAELKKRGRDMSLSPEERFQAHLDLAKLPRNSSRTRANNRCEITGRARGYYRKFRVSRIALRELALSGQIPGMVKSSW